MAPGTDLRLDCRFFWLGRLMVLMTGDAIDPVLGMLAIDPGQKDSTGLLLMASQTLSNVFFCPYHRRGGKEQKKDKDKHHSFYHGIPQLFLFLFQ
jgi:hypothetical protein